MIRVLIFDTSSRLGSVGGAQRIATNLFYELPKRGLSTFYLGCKTDYFKGSNKNAMFLKTPKQKKLKEMGQRSALRPVIENRLVRIGYYSLYSLRGINISEMSKFVSKIKPDVVIANSILDYIILKRLKRYMPNAKIVYIDHANASGNYKGPFDYNIMQLTFGTGSFVGLEKARKRLFGFFNGIIAINSEQKESIEKYNKNIVVIHNALLLDVSLPSKASIESFRKRSNLWGCKIVLYLGRLADAQKNVGILIKAFKHLKGEKYRLLIVGEGKSGDLYKKMSESDQRIKILGHVDEKMLPYYYSIADLYVLPSIWESFPNLTSIEAATFGAPLLLSENVVNNDIKKRFGKQLLLFNPNDEEELREKISLALNDVNTKKALIKLSKELAKEFSKKAQMDSYAYAIKKIYSDGTFVANLS